MTIFDLYKYSVVCFPSMKTIMCFDSY